MAKAKSGNKVTKSLFETLKAKGYEVSTQKTILWEKGDLLAEGHEEFDLYISQKYEGSAFCIVREGDESKAISFGKGEIDGDDYTTTNDKGLVASGDVDFSIDIYECIALRDDEELGITKGDTTLKAFVS